MKLKIQNRLDAPEINLFVEIITKDGKSLGERPIMLLVPGGPGGNHTVYHGVRDELLNYCDLVLFDPRGCGKSDLSKPEFCTLSHFIEDIESVRKELNLDKIILLGGSYGAMASLGYAIKYGAHLEKLILIAGSPSYRFIEIAKRNLKERGSKEQIEIAENLWNGTFKDAEHFKEYYKMMASLYLNKKMESKDVVPTTKPSIPYNISITNLGFGGFLRKFDFEPDLEKVSCETLILSGENDWINDPICAKAMADKIPKNNLMIFQNCGHFIWEDQRDKFFESISAFLDNKTQSETMLKSKI